MRSGAQAGAGMHGVRRRLLLLSSSGDEQGSFGLGVNEGTRLTALGRATLAGASLTRNLISLGDGDPP